jgi:hypothetical protein
MLQPSWPKKLRPVLNETHTRKERPLCVVPNRPMPSSSSKVLPFPTHHPGATVLNGPALVERRSKVRYPLDLSVRFRCFAGKSLRLGAGRTVDVSSSGVLVVSPRVLSPHEISVGLNNPEQAMVGVQGAVVDVGLKSGTNVLHGSAYAYGRYTAWDAKSTYIKFA